MAWKTKGKGKNAIHYNTDKKVRDVSDNDVDIEINLANADELEEFAKEKAEDSIKIRKDKYWDEIGDSIDKIEDEVEETGLELVKSSGMTKYGQAKVAETVEYIKDQYGLWLNNTNFTEHIGEDEDDGYRQELITIKEQVLESAMWFHDKDFGYSDDVREKPKDEAERIGQQIFEVFDKMKDDELENLEDREGDYAKGKQIIKDVVEEGFESSMRNLPR